MRPGSSSSRAYTSRPSTASTAQFRVMPLGVVAVPRSKQPLPPESPAQDPLVDGEGRHAPVADPSLPDVVAVTSDSVNRGAAALTTVDGSSSRRHSTASSARGPPAPPQSLPAVVPPRRPHTQQHSATTARRRSTATGSGTLGATAEASPATARIASHALRSLASHFVEPGQLKIQLGAWPATQRSTSARVSAPGTNADRAEALPPHLKVAKSLRDLAAACPSAAELCTTISNFAAELPDVAHAAADDELGAFEATTLPIEVEAEVAEPLRHVEQYWNDAARDIDRRANRSATVVTHARTELREFLINATLDVAERLDNAVAENAAVVASNRRYNLVHERQAQMAQRALGMSDTKEKLESLLRHNRQLEADVRQAERGLEAEKELNAIRLQRMRDERDAKRAQVQATLHRLKESIAELDALEQRGEDVRDETTRQEALGIDTEKETVVWQEKLAAPEIEHNPRLTPRPPWATIELGTWGIDEDALSTEQILKLLQQRADDQTAVAKRASEDAALAKKHCTQFLAEAASTVCTFSMSATFGMFAKADLTLRGAADGVAVPAAKWSASEVARYCSNIAALALKLQRVAEPETTTAAEAVARVAAQDVDFHSANRGELWGSWPWVRKDLTRQAVRHPIGEQTAAQLVMQAAHAAKLATPDTNAVAYAYGEVLNGRLPLKLFVCHSAVVATLFEFISAADSLQSTGRVPRPMVVTCLQRAFGVHGLAPAAVQHAVLALPYRTDVPVVDAMNAALGPIMQALVEEQRAAVGAMKTLLTNQAYLLPSVNVPFVCVSEVAAALTAVGAGALDPSRVNTELLLSMLVDDVPRATAAELFPLKTDSVRSASDSMDASTRAAVRRRATTVQLPPGAEPAPAAPAGGGDASPPGAQRRQSSASPQTNRRRSSAGASASPRRASNAAAAATSSDALINFVQSPELVRIASLGVLGGDRPGASALVAQALAGKASSSGRIRPQGEIAPFVAAGRGTVKKPPPEAPDMVNADTVLAAMRTVCVRGYARGAAA